MKTRSIDYHAVEEHHIPVHERLINWAMWAKPGKGVAVSAMFKGWKSNAWQWHPAEYRPTVNELDAQAVEKGICKLPKRHMEAIKWAYLVRCNPGKHTRHIAASDAGLCEILRNARQMLTNILPAAI